MKEYRREYQKLRRLLRRASVYVAPPPFFSGGTPDPEALRRHFEPYRGVMLLRDEIEAAVGKPTWKELAWDYNGGSERAAKGKRRAKRVIGGR
jgi:hypothetical protein